MRSITPKGVSRVKGGRAVSTRMLEANNIEKKTHHPLTSRTNITFSYVSDLSILVGDVRINKNDVGKSLKVLLLWLILLQSDASFVLCGNAS